MFKIAESFDFLMTRGHFNWLRQARRGTAFENIFHAPIIIAMILFLAVLPVICYVLQISAYDRYPRRRAVSAMLAAIICFGIVGCFVPAKAESTVSVGSYVLKEEDYALMTSGKAKAQSMADLNESNGVSSYDVVNVYENDGANSRCIGWLYYNRKTDNVCFADFRGRDGDEYSLVREDENYNYSKGKVYVYSLSEEDGTKLMDNISRTGNSSVLSLRVDAQQISLKEIISAYMRYDRKRLMFIILAPIALIASVILLIIDLRKYSREKTLLPAHRAVLALSAADICGIQLLFVLSFVLKLF